MGLSNKKGDVKVKSYENSTLNSIVDYPHDGDFYWAKSKTTTGDEFSKDNDIDHINFLKIDVEGYEPQVLEGFKNMLSEKAIDIIQFEYGKANIYTKIHLKEIYDFLERYGYKIGKIYPNNVNFKDYKPEHEDFMGPNFIACLPDYCNILNKSSR